MTGPTKKRTVLEPFKNAEAARALRAARKSAGYKSASAAAEACGFTNAKYRSHEAGARPMSADEIATYAAAFNVDTNTILNPWESGIGQVIEKVENKRHYDKYMAKKLRQSAGTRLKISRLARGHDSARQAGFRFELTLPTYFGHEAGISTISPGFARLYAAIFGARDSWILNGDLPSGLGARVDHELAKDPGYNRARDFRHLALPYLPPSDADIAKLKSAAKAADLPEWTSNAGDVLRVINFSTFRQHGLDAIAMKPDTYWPLPKGFVRSAFGANLDDILVAVPESRPGLDRDRSRLFVDTKQTALKEQVEFLVMKDGVPCVIDGGPAQTDTDVIAVGRIIAKFTSYI